MHVFLCNDLEVIDACFPLEATMTRGRHMMVRMQSGTRPRSRQPLAEDEYEDDNGNLFWQYPMEDDPEQVQPAPTLQTLGRSDQRQPREGAGRGRRRARTQGVSRSKCGVYGQAEHNQRTCTSTPWQVAKAQEGRGVLREETQPV